uniref:Uncharacterized protein n=1 Tax=Caenorhabditis japonica TaxID=281687 RepID=A0A8R1HUP4_CAEJA
MQKNVYIPSPVIQFDESAFQYSGISIESFPWCEPSHDQYGHSKTLGLPIPQHQLAEQFPALASRPPKRLQLPTNIPAKITRHCNSVDYICVHIMTLGKRRRRRQSNMFPS